MESTKIAAEARPSVLEFRVISALVHTIPWCFRYAAMTRSSCSELKFWRAPITSISAVHKVEWETDPNPTRAQASSTDMPLRPALTHISAHTRAFACTRVHTVGERQHGTHTPYFTHTVPTKY